MRIRITPLPRDTSRFQRDGIDLSHYRVGEFYDVGSTLGTHFIVMGIAEPALRILDQEQTGRNDHLATVLLVDDVLDQLDMYEMAIETRYRVLRASRGRDALELATQATPDIIVLDVMLPDVNGVTLCQQLKARTATALIPVLLITAYASPLIEANGIEVGAVAVLAKPCPPDQLISAIDTALRAV